jgi:hypothetical protein
MKTDAQRIAHYEARMMSTQIDPVLAAVNAKACQNFATYEIDFYPNQVALRNLLSAAGILPVKYGAYEAYHGELYHMSKVCQGDALVAAATILIDKWKDTAHLGAGAGVLLAQIATDIYHIVFIGTP